MNAYPPISVTEFGIVIEVKVSHPEKAYFPTLVTEDGIVDIEQALTNVFVAVSIMALQLSRESNVLLPLSTLISVKLSQLLKRHPPICLTDAGMINEVIPVHPEKAFKPILITELGIVTEVKPLQLWNASEPISVTELGIVIEVKLLQP